jgi:hypothetical protein
MARERSSEWEVVSAPELGEIRLEWVRSVFGDAGVEAYVEHCQFTGKNDFSWFLCISDIRNRLKLSADELLRAAIRAAPTSSP